MINLSNREKQVLSLIVQEKSSSTIAKLLGISIRTVDTHRKNIGRKLETKSLIGLTKYAIKEGMLTEFKWKPYTQKRI